MGRITFSNGRSCSSFTADSKTVTRETLTGKRPYLFHFHMNGVQHTTKEDLSFIAGETNIIMGEEKKTKESGGAPIKCNILFFYER